MSSGLLNVKCPNPCYVSITRLAIEFLKYVSDTCTINCEPFYEFVVVFKPYKIVKLSDYKYKLDCFSYMCSSPFMKSGIWLDEDRSIYFSIIYFTWCKTVMKYVLDMFIY